MKKKIAFAALFLFSAFVLFLSCDKVKPPYMKVNDITDCPVPVFPDDTHHVKTLLLEDFTGHLCINCPEAAHYVHQIKQTHGEKIVVLSIHAGGTADPNSTGNYTLDLRPSAGLGDELYNHFAIPANPRAMFNRELIGGNRNFGGSSSWPGLVDQVIAGQPELFIQIINNYDSASRKLCTHVKPTFLTSTSATLKLVVMIAEDSITGYQKNSIAAYGPTPDITNYTFNDVLRASFNGAFGENLASPGTSAGSSLIKSYKMMLDQNWTARHCKIVAYIYNADTEVILQAAEKHIY